MLLRRTKDFAEYTLAATDTDVGKIADFYFDDRRWTIRYIVVDTGTILPGRKVLLSPLSLRQPAFEPFHLRVNLTVEQIVHGPSVDLHKPISKQHEADHQKYYGLPDYKDGDGLWGAWPRPGDLLRAASPSAPKKPAPAGPPQPAPPPQPSADDVHLRSVREVIGYALNAVDGEIGHVEDFLFDDETWELRYAIVDTGSWWPGKKVLLRPRWIERVSWAEQVMYTALSRDRVRNSPDWNPDEPLSRDYELRLHKHYGYAPDWTEVK